MPKKAPSTPGRPPLPEFRIGQKAASTPALTTGHPVAPRMDARAFGRMKRGKLQPDARIDLHGMTAATAHAALIAFLMRAAADDKRLVLVITGKGRDDAGALPLADRRGVLRRQLPHWLETPPLAQIVLQVETAHQRHGGSGAYYVYLARRK